MRAQIASRAAPRARVSCGLGLVLLAGAACQQTVLFELPGDGAAGASGADGGGFCPGGQPFATQPKPESPQIIVALDRSAAMFGPFGSTNGAQATLDALDAVVSQYQAVSFGYVEFPEAFGCGFNADCCASQVTPPSPDNGSFHYAAHRCDANAGPGCLSSSDRPTGMALASCQGAFVNGPGPHFVLLVTDGEPTPTCTIGDSCPDTMTISKLQNAGIMTAVVVVQNAPIQDDSCLREFAQTGGLSENINGIPSYFSASTPEDLTATLKMIVGTRMAPAACKLDLHSAPDNPEQVTLYIGATLIPHSGPPDGWDFVDSSHMQIQLSGSSCQLLLGSPAGSVGLAGCSNGRH